jgi:putative ABC transport system permease protein
MRRIVESQGREYVERFTTVKEEIDDALIENRFLAYLSGAFSALALGVAAVGLFGLLSYQVSSRTAEIGIRIALGARPLEVQTLFFRQVAALLFIGSTGGVALLFMAQKAIASFLFGTSVSNLSLFLFSTAVLAATALAASWIPVRRACRIDPSRALHHA